MRVFVALWVLFHSACAASASDAYAVVPFEREFQCDAESYVILGMFTHPAEDASAPQAVGFVIAPKNLRDSKRVATSALKYRDGSPAFAVQVDKVHFFPRDRFLLSVYERSGRLVIGQIRFAFRDAPAESIVEDAINAFRRVNKPAGDEDGEPGATDNPDDAQ